MYEKNHEPFATFECKRCTTFSTDSALSDDEQQQQMKKHLDAFHPYWDFENLEVGAQNYKDNFHLVTRERRDYVCAHCRTIISANTSICPNCRTNTTRLIEPQANEQLNRTGTDRKQMFGIIGSILLFSSVCSLQS